MEEFPVKNRTFMTICPQYRNDKALSVWPNHTGGMDNRS